MANNNQLTNEYFTRSRFAAAGNFLGFLPNPDTILRRTGKTIEAYRDLKNDPHVWSCIQSRKSGVLCLEHTLVPSGAPAHVLREVDQIIRDLDIRAVERDALEAPLFGFQPMEIVWKQSGKMLAPESFSAKPQEWFAFDSTGALCAKSEIGMSAMPIARHKIVNVRYEADYKNPYGQALLGKCYWQVQFKRGGLRFWVNFSERYGMPLLLGQFSRGASPEEAKELAEQLSQMAEDTVIVAPADISVSMHEASRNSSVNLFRELIHHCNSEISKALLSQTLTTEINMGSYAAAETHFKIRREVIQSDCRLVEQAMNELISSIVELNFGPVASPRFRLVMNDGQSKEQLERDLRLAASTGFHFTKEYWMEHYGFREGEIVID